MLLSLSYQSRGEHTKIYPIYNPLHFQHQEKKSFHIDHHLCSVVQSHAPLRAHTESGSIIVIPRAITLLHDLTKPQQNAASCASFDWVRAPFLVAAHRIERQTTRPHTLVAQHVHIVLLLFPLAHRNGCFHQQV